MKCRVLEGEVGPALLLMQINAHQKEFFMPLIKASSNVADFERKVAALTKVRVALHAL